MHRGRQCTAPNELPDAGPGDALKGALPGVGGGVNAFFCLVSSLQCVGKRVAWIQELCQCSVMVVMRDLVDCWTIWTTSIMLYYPMCVPLDVGGFYVFCTLFRLPNVG